MTKPTPLETATARLRDSLTAAQAEWEEARTLFTQAESSLNRRRERVVALSEALNLLHPVALVETAPAVRAKPGAVEEAILVALASGGLGSRLEGLVERTTMNRGSLQAALRRMVAAGTLRLEGEVYRRPAAPEGTAASAAE